MSNEPFRLTQEQFEACKQLGKFLTGELDEVEAESIKHKIVDQDALYYPLWKNRSRFTNDFLRLLKSEE
ncbi:MAG: hypothetical protein AAFN77_18140 [Planctomycetota bacterium]